jgi:hypothetical protein
VPAGFIFLHTGHTSHRPCGGCGTSGFCPLSEPDIVTDELFLFQKTELSLLSKIIGLCDFGWVFHA